MTWHKLNRLYYGGDYNPDQWDEEVWMDDIEKLKELHVNVLTLPVFSWAKCQPSETTYNFEWLDKIFDLTEANGISINLATPTAAQPPWMIKAYPDILPVDKNGVKRKFGGRTQFCPNSPSFRKFSRNIAQKMAQRYKDRQSLILWHINNEYGTYCYCETCRKEFIEWLKEKYKTLEMLNEKWYTHFWGHTYYDWDEIQTVSYLTELLPNALGTRDGTNFQAMAIDYRRFMTKSIMDCYKNEADIIRSITPEIPITTNIWGIAPWIDLFEVGRTVDVVSWDSYPTNEEHYSVSSFKHDIIRSLKKNENFILMEQTPNQQNWQSFNALKRPGVMRLMSYQTMAHGADALLFFQIRQSRGACEKYHAAMIPHVGHLNTRNGKELIQLGSELERLSSQMIGSKIQNKVAMVMSWDNWWSVEYSSGPSIDLNYFDLLHRYYKILNGLNISVDIIEPSDDMSPYDLILAPLLNRVSTTEQKNIEKYVEAGGKFISTYFSGYVDEHDLVHLGGYPGALKNLMGIWVEEVDALPRGETNRILSMPGSPFKEPEYSCSLIYEIIHLEGAKCLAKFGADYYKGVPSVTENDFGKGKAVYIGTQPDEAFIRELLSYYLKDLILGQVSTPQEDIEIVCRKNESEAFYFIMNHSHHAQTINISRKYEDLLTGNCYETVAEIKGKDLLILKKSDL